MDHSKLYCPPVTKPSIQNELIVHVTEHERGRWMVGENERLFGNVRYEWYGEMGELGSVVNSPPSQNGTLTTWCQIDTVDV